MTIFSCILACIKSTHEFLDLCRHFDRLREDLLGENDWVQLALINLELKLECPEDDDSEPLKFVFEFLFFLGDILHHLREALCFLLCGVGVVRSEFGVRKRPKCTTMPWDIWPSLVVLWGVCWMFYTPLSPSEQLLFQHDFEGDQMTEILPDFSSYPLISNQPLLGDFPYQDPFGFFDVSNPSNLDFFGQTGFQAQASQPNSHDIQSFEVPSGQPIRSEAEPTWYSNTAGSTTSAPAAIQSSMLSQTASAGIAMSPNNPDPQIQSSRGSSTQAVPQDPPRNSEDNYVCTVVGCNCGRTFERHSSWQTHTDKYTLPFHCPEEGCTSRAATKGVMKRHLERVQKKPSSEASSLSKRSENISPSAPVDTAIVATSAEGPSIAAPDKGKGVAKRSLTPSDNIERGGNEPFEAPETEMRPKKVRRIEGGGVPGSASSACDESLVAENERLKRELEMSQRELALSRKELQVSEKQLKWYQELLERGQL